MTGQPNRLLQGGRIDRTKPLSFTFDGRAIDGFEGDSIASALLANDVFLVARSFKFHRPRGIMAAGAEEANALIGINIIETRGGREAGDNDSHFPNILATTTPAQNGLETQSQNAWPSLALDLMAVNNLLSPLFSAGFYYKTFMGPGRRAWTFYEHFIRRAAGMGRASTKPDPARYENGYLFCDCLVVGAGPSGLAAAWQAAQDGSRVILAERQSDTGGMLLDEPNDSAAGKWRLEMRAKLAAMPNVRVMTDTEVFGAYDDHNFGLLQDVTPLGTPLRENQPRQRYWSLRCARTIVATGALERPIAFANNDLPGVMLAGAIRTYVGRYGVLPGRQIIFFTNNDSAYLAALNARRAGAKVTLIDCRKDGPDQLVQECKAAGIKVKTSAVVTKAIGRKRISAIQCCGIDSSGALLDKTAQRLDCDLLGVSGGWNPLIHVPSQLGGKARYDEALACFTITDRISDCQIVGSAAGLFDTSSCIASVATQAPADPPSSLPSEPDLRLIGGDQPWQQPIHPLWAVPLASHRLRQKSFVDFQHDVKLTDISLAHREGYVSVEHLKRYTTLGMAMDQGRTSNVSALAVMAGLQDQSINATGTTRFRPPTSPITIGAIAGDATGQHYKPSRLTPLYQWHQKNGAVFTEAGLWLRAHFYPRENEGVTEAYVREAGEVRQSAGLVDVSTLGKIDINGPDAGEFLNRIYMNGFAKLPIGKARYGVMLRDDGYVFDDGTVSRIDEHHYFMTTTTAEAAHVLARMEFMLQTQWQHLRVHVTSVTDQWAGMALAGPQSRDILKTLIKDIDFDNAAFPFMGVRHGTLEGMPLRLLRISFSGEMAFEIYTPAGFGQELWQRIFASSKVFAYGTEAMSALRIEKGFIAAAEIDGRTTPYDLGLLGMAGKTKPFIGRTLLQRKALAGPQRPSLVGFRPVSRKDRLRAGAIICEPGHHSGHGVGHISSRTYSPATGHDIALGFIKGGMQRLGDELDACSPIYGETVKVEIVDPCFYDKPGARNHG